MMPRKSISDEATADQSDDAQSPVERSRKRGRRSKKDICNDIFRKLKVLKKVDGTLYVDALRIPNKRSNPEFFDAISSPMDPAKMSGKLKSDEYIDIADMANDIKLMVSNCRSFFGVSSQEAIDATAFEEAFNQASQKGTSVASTSSKSSSVSRRRRSKRVKPAEYDDDEEEEEEEDDDIDIDDASVTASEASTTATSASHRSVHNEQTQEAFFAAVAQCETEDGRQLSQTFATLPTKEAFPQYYEIITEPIDFRMIARRILSGFYHNLTEIEKDFIQIARNARHFNEPKSIIYQDAKILARIAKSKKTGAWKSPGRICLAEKGESTPHEITEEFANLPDVVEMAVPPPKITIINKSASEASDKESSVNRSPSSSSNQLIVKRKRGRPPRQRPADSSPESSSNSSTPSRQPSVSRRSQSRDASSIMDDTGDFGDSQMEISQFDQSHQSPITHTSPTVAVASHMSPSLNSSPSPFVKMMPTQSSSGPQQYGTELIPSMLSSASTGSLRWWGEHVLEAVCTATNQVGDILALPFLRLPAKKQYADYFRKIAHPICLAKIRRRIKRNEYQTLADVRNDLDLVFSNAMAYNARDSQTYNEAAFLQQLAREKFVELSQYSGQAENMVRPSRGGVKRSNLPGNFTGEEDLHLTPTKRTPGRRILTVEEAKTRRLNNLFVAVYNYKDEFGHYPRDTFLQLPSKEEYPDYYTVIQEPIDLQIIKERMETNKYMAHQGMVADLRLMFSNAKTYNEENSQVYRDAVTLDKVVKKKLKSLGPHSTPTATSTQSPNFKPQQDMSMMVNYSGMVSPGGVVMTMPGATVQPAPGLNVPPMQRLMIEVFQAVREYCDISGRQISNPFLRLPSKTELPAYYEFIKKPIELHGIAKTILHDGYQDFGEFMSDLFLMFNNACIFNEPDSQIYKDTLILHQVAITKRNMLLSAAFSSGAPILGLLPPTAPDISPGIRRLLTSLHNAMLTACDSEGRGLVDSLIAGDGTESSVTSATAARLAALHRSVAAGAYRRLDRLQADWLEVLKRARIGEDTSLDEVKIEKETMDSSNRPTSQQRQDAAELARRWVRLRDSLCKRQVPQQIIQSADNEISLPTHLHIVSTATNYSEVVLERDLVEETQHYEPLVFVDDDGEAKLPSLAEGEVELPVVESKGQMYRIGDYVYAENSKSTQYLIGRIMRISETTTSPEIVEHTVATVDGEPTTTTIEQSETKTISVRLAVYMRPTEAKPSRRRRLLAAEVFRTVLSELLPVSKLQGHCLVLPINQFIRSRPKNIDERDVFVCESQFSIMGQIFVKLRRWGVPTPYGVELEDRPVPFVPTRLPPSEPLESALEQVNTSAFSCMTFPLSRPIQTVIDDMNKAEGTVSYEQYVHENEFTVKQGDCLFVAASNTTSPEHRQIVRVEKIWKNSTEDSVFVTGPVMVSAQEVEHLPTRVFYPREVIMTANDRATYSLSSVLGKCFVMRPADFCIARPTSYRESDIYICESKYYEDEKEIRKMKKGFKKFNFTPETLQDEYFFFSHPISPHKEASPLLAKASPLPLNLDQLNRPVQSALSSVVAAASNTIIPTSSGLGAASSVQTQPITTSHMDSPQHQQYSIMKPDSSTPMMTKLAPNLTQTMDAGQLAFMEVGLDRSGKKRKLRKPPSGYVIYAGEVRKKLLQDRPEAPFGEISREVGLLWRQMPAQERDIYERKAQVIKRRMEEEETQSKVRAQQEQVRLQQQQIMAQQQQQQAAQQQQEVAMGMHQHDPSRSQANDPQSAQQQLISMMPSSGHQSVQLQSSSMQQQPGGNSGQSMHFYQTPQGPQLIQLMHTSSASNGMPRDQQHPIMTNQMSAASLQQSVIAANGNQQVVYQFAGQQGGPPGMVPQNVNMGGGAPQVILTHPMGQQGPPQLSNQNQFTNAMMQPRQTAVPMPGQQHQVQVLQQLTTGVDGHVTSSIGHQLGGGMQGVNTMPSQTSGSMQGAIQTGTPIMTVPQPPPRPPSPLFVSVPPRTSRVLHSEIYQRYIDRLRRNAPGLSDWRKQITSTIESVPPLVPLVQQQLVNNFIDTPQLHAHQGTVVEALWNLRDNLLKDSLNIRTRCLAADEM